MTPVTLPEDVVTVPEPAPVTVTVGGRVEARVSFAIADGFHIQANPASTEFFVPTKIQIRAKGGIRPKGAVYPPGLPYRPEGMPDDLSTYEKSLVITVPLEAGDSARPGEHILKGTIRYQACDDHSCLFPASVPFSLKVTVMEG